MNAPGEEAGSIPWLVMLTERDRRRSLSHRLGLTVLAAVDVLTAIPGVVLLIVGIVSVPLALIGVGIVTGWLTVRCLPQIVRWQTASASALTRTPLDGQVPRTWPKLGDALRNKSFWRSWALVLYTATLGLAISVIVVGLLLGPVIYLVLLIIEPSILWLFVLTASVALWAVWWIGTPMLLHGRAEIAATILGASRSRRLAERIQQVEKTRADTLDRVGSEVRRIERDLHDGAQARLAAVGMSVGLAENLVRTDPATAVALLREARESTIAALEDIRSVVRGIHPPVLADRGLHEAVHALAIGSPIPTGVDIDLPSRPGPALESALYFAIAECLANAIKHSHADRVNVTGAVHDSRARFLVTDDGTGGADPDGHGLGGLADRLGVFDGVVIVDSPQGGPTSIVLEVPWN